MTYNNIQKCLYSTDADEGLAVLLPPQILLPPLPPLSSPRDSQSSRSGRAALPLSLSLTADGLVPGERKKNSASGWHFTA